jgi:hypothetical protein
MACSSPMSASGLALMALLSGCGHCADDMPLHYVEGLLPGHSDLSCELYDGDSTVISFSYTLPNGTTPQQALRLLEASVSRSMWKEGVTPPVTCYRVVARRPGYLLMACEGPGSGSTSAWEFVLEGQRLRATTGPAQYVLDFTVHKE